ncbi:DUF4838 domain-containing protein [Crocinitomicaceae bacterium]|nr:DUF4838 domain-containing protein [Crocinitomicaceae bacterium]
MAARIFGLPFVEQRRPLVKKVEELADWPQRAKDAGLTTIGVHHQNSPQAVIRCVKSDVGQRFLEQCQKLGLEVEYELHAMKELLPRELFAKNPDMFRMDDKGQRVADFNCCVHSDRALEIICQNALAIAKVLRPTSSRYFYWGDDGRPWCQCPKCQELSPSEQALVIENRLCRALREVDLKAQVAHLSYHNTLTPPKKVKPDEGVFLEFAPIKRRYDIPYEQQQDPKLAEGLHALKANLDVFPKDTAQVLEYWLDVSRFSRWKRPGVKLPWNREVFVADVETYRTRGIRHVTTFAAWIDAKYRERFGDLDFIEEYGEGLLGR